MKAKIVGLSILGIVVAAVTAAIVFVGPVDVSIPEQEVDEFESWNRSGPFAINKKEYKVGENIFMAVGPLQTTDAGNIVFVMPNGTTQYISIPFNGAMKSDFNQYFKPSISKGRHICSIDDLVGEWIVVFTKTEYEPIKFRILNETIPTEVAIFAQVC